MHQEASMSAVRPRDPAGQQRTLRRTLGPSLHESSSIRVADCLLADGIAPVSRTLP